MNINDVYKSNSNHLAASDIPPGKQVQLTINGYEVADFEDDGKTTRKIVLGFSNTDKTLVLNKTNALTIASVLGDDTDMWVGKAICVYSTKVDFGGKMVDAIRIFMPRETVAPQQAAPQPAPQRAGQPAKEFDDVPW